jgi:DNA-directed RNA polymerase specialized sigma24 family protein
VTPSDDPAVREFLTHDYRRTVGAVALVVGDRDVAEDAVQEALERAMRRRHRADALRGPAAWITVVALNVARRRFRRAATARRAIERLPVRSPEADTTDAIALRSTLAALPAANAKSWCSTTSADGRSPRRRATWACTTARSRRRCRVRAPRSRSSCPNPNRKPSP